jgi:hypothetical protein
MNYLFLLEKLTLGAVKLHVLGFGGGGGSTRSEQSTTTTNDDHSINGTNGHVVTGGTLSITNADAEAINAQNTELLRGISGNMTDVAALMLNTGRESTRDMINAQATTSQANTEALKALAGASKELIAAQGQNAQQNGSFLKTAVMTLGGVIAAFILFKAKK